MNVTFATLSKRRNSTKQFTGGTSYTCILKDGSGVVNPTIILKWNGTSAPTGYNVAYISAFNRYYWVDEWTYIDRCWEASLRSDVLASARAAIGSSSKYVLRSSYTFNNNITDSIYPAKTDSTTYNVNLSGLAFANQLDYGRFVVGIIGQGNTFSTAGVGYIVVTGTQLQQIMDACFTQSADLWNWGQPPQTIEDAIQEFGADFTKSVVNPIQFINSVVWIPFSPNISGTTTVHLGSINTGISASCLGAPIVTQTFSTGSVLPMAITANNGKWKCMEPYTRYKLVCPPFGTFDLNSAQIVERNGVVSGSVWTDCMTGLATLQLDNFGITASAQLGIQIQLAGSSVDYAGAIKTAIGGVSNTIAAAGAGLLSGGIAGAISGAIGGVASGIIDTVSAASPQATQGSIGGGLAALKASRYINVIYFPCADEDNAERGKPLMEFRTISNIPGFIMCADGEVSSQLSPGELEEIERYLIGGFFYE